MLRAANGRPYGEREAHSVRRCGGADGADCVPVQRADVGIGPYRVSVGSSTTVGSWARAGRILSRKSAMETARVEVLRQG